MKTVFEKLNLKDHREIVVLQAPESFEKEISRLSGVTVRRDLGPVGEVGFSLAFVTRQAELDSIAAAVTAKAEGDAILWFAYPKKSSKRYHCELDRDSGWEALGAAGFEPVRQVAIDEDWSALRFRRAEHIKSMRRDPKHALSEAGRRKAAAGR